MFLLGNRSIQRWLDLITLAIIGGFLTITLHPFFSAAIQPLRTHIQAMAPSLHFGGTLVITLVPWLVLSLFRGLDSKQIVRYREIMRYPPIWLACWSVLLCLTAAELLKPNPQVDSTGLLCSSIAFFVALVVRPLKEYLQGIALDGYGPTSLSRSTAEWTVKEEPIRSLDEDKFGVEPIVERIVRRVLSPEFPTIGIFGPFGIGKTSVLHMVETRVNELFRKIRSQRSSTTTSVPNTPCQDVVFVTVDSWGRDKSTLSQQVLNAAIDALAQHIDCSSVSTLPTAYRVSLSQVSPLWRSVTELLLDYTSSPDRHLHRLDSVAAAVGYRVVIVIEDLDRSVAPNELQSDMVSFLDRLRGLRHISFVWTLSTTSHSITDATRICEQIEYMPHIDDQMTLRVLTQFRDESLQQIFRDPVSIEDRQSRFIDERSLEIARHFGTEPYMVPYSAITLIDTPRTLKTILRRTREAWNNLRGEIDFDDLLLSNVLRFASPDAFAFLHSHVHEIRAMDHRPITEKGRSHRERLREELLARVQDPQERTEYVNAVIAYLFPQWKENSQSDESEAPQGVRRVLHTDYWIRLHREALLPNEVQDQQVIEHLVGISAADETDGTVGEVADFLLSSSEFASAFRTFAPHYIGIREVHLLATEINKRVLEREGIRAGRQTHAGTNCLVPAANGIVRRKSLDLDEHHRWVLREMEIALQVSLHFAWEVYCDWRSIEQEHLEQTQVAADLQTQAIEVLRKAFMSTPERFLAVLDPEAEDLSKHIVFTSNTHDMGGAGFFSEQWEWYSDMLMVCLGISRDVALSQSAGLIIESGSRMSRARGRTELGTAFSLNLNFARGLFRGRVKDLIVELADGYEIRGADAFGVQRRDYAVLEAKRLLDSGELL